jgi:hypothetical protein
MRRPFLMTAVVLAWPAAAADPPSPPPDPEFLEFLGETSGVDDDLVLFMRSPEAEKALKDASKQDSKEDDDEQ